MKVIKAPNEKVLKLWGKPKLKTDSLYRLMAYVLVLDCGDATLLHNCVTGEMIALHKEKQILNSLPSEYSDCMDQLIEKRFLVPVEYDDKKVVLQLRGAFKIMYPQKEIVSYTILPTTACNARCFYCYESGIERVDMREETAVRLVNFIKEHHGGKNIILKWFGGEPLLGRARIDQICRLLKENGISYLSNITSNGLLLSKETVCHAKLNWNLKEAQITVDGTEEVYNKTKAYVNVTGNPYYKVMENIGHLLENGITVKMRMNLSKTNADDLKNLIDDVALRFKGKENLIPYVASIYEGVGFEPAYYTDLENALLDAKKTELQNYIAECGFKKTETPLPLLSKGYCMADNDGAVLIGPNGDIGKCEHHIFDRLIGSIYDTERNKEEISLWKETVEFENCNTCPIYPSCFMLKKCDRNNSCTEFQQNSKIRKYKEIMLDIYHSEKLSTTERSNAYEIKV